MLQDERLEGILEFINKNERIDVETICNMNQVSKDTARRDLIKLEELRKVVRIRGGAKRVQAYNEIYNHDQRLVMASDAKRKIGEQAAFFIKSGDQLILDASTTVQSMAKFLSVENLLIVTNSIEIARILSIRENISINLLGGTINNKHMAIYGSRTIKNVQDFRVNKCFIGTCGISANGLSTSIEEEGLLVHEMIKQSDKVIVLADSTKFNKTFFQKVCDLDEIDIVITEKEVEGNMKKILERHGVDVIIGT